MRTLTRRVAALAIVSTLTLSACGSSDSDGDSAASDDATTSAPSSDAPETSDTPDADADTDAAAGGATITGDGFSFSTPEGWADQKTLMPTALAVAADLTDTDGFADNINVINDPTLVDVDTDKIEDAVEKVLANVKAQDIQIKDTVEVDGEEAVHVGAIFEQNGVKYRTEQFATDHDGKGYVLTFSFSETVSEGDREALADSILATWKWSS